MVEDGQMIAEAAAEVNLDSPWPMRYDSAAFWPREARDAMTTKFRTALPTAQHAAPVTFSYGHQAVGVCRRDPGR